MAARAGPRNLITDVPGILIGQAEDQSGVTGTTVVLAEASAVASVDVRGGAPGSRETELLAPGTLVDRVDHVIRPRCSRQDVVDKRRTWCAESGEFFHRDHDNCGLAADADVLRALLTRSLYKFAETRLGVLQLPIRLIWICIRPCHGLSLPPD